jgi:hypothetical protein
MYILSMIFNLGLRWAISAMHDGRLAGWRNEMPTGFLSGAALKKSSGMHVLDRPV